MSKKALKRATMPVKVQAVFRRFKKDENGNLTNIALYDIFGPERMKRI